MGLRGLNPPLCCFLCVWYIGWLKDHKVILLLPDHGLQLFDAGIFCKLLYLTGFSLGTLKSLSQLLRYFDANPNFLLYRSCVKISCVKLVVSKLLIYFDRHHRFSFEPDCSPFTKFARFHMVVDFMTLYLQTWLHRFFAAETVILLFPGESNLVSKDITVDVAPIVIVIFAITLYSQVALTRRQWRDLLSQAATCLPLTAEAPHCPFNCWTSSREAVNTNFYSLWFDPTGNQTWVYCFSSRCFSHWPLIGKY